jgi:hypothetical protein
MMALRAIVISAAASLLSAAGPTSVSFSANDTDFLNMMGNLEGPRGYGTVFDGVPALPQAQIDDMNIGEVLDYQRSIRKMGTASSAVGRYQFIYLTLQDLVEKQGISEAMIFDGEMQTFLARTLMSNCGFYDVDQQSTALGDCLAGVWAALPRVSGPGRGSSVYAGDGLNKSLVSADRVMQVLEDRFTW